MKFDNYMYKSGDLMVRPVDESDVWNCKWDVFLLKDSDQERIGWVSFEGPKERGTIPISIEIEPHFRRQGHGTAVLKMMHEWAFFHKDIFEITTQVSNENTELIHALERAGFIYRDGLSIENGVLETYSITKQKSSWTGLYIVIGIIAGMILGLVLDNMWVGLAISVFFALAFGIGMDLSERKWREKITGKKNSKDGL